MVLRTGELLDNIFDSIWSLSLIAGRRCEGAKRHEILGYALVCKAWSDSALRALWGCPFHGWHDWKDILRVLSSIVEEEEKVGWVF
jgi:hypothetical protein